MRDLLRHSAEFRCLRRFKAERPLTATEEERYRYLDRMLRSSFGRSQPPAQASTVDPAPSPGRYQQWLRSPGPRPALSPSEAVAPQRPASGSNRPPVGSRSSESRPRPSARRTAMAAPGRAAATDANRQIGRSAIGTNPSPRSDDLRPSSIDCPLSGWSGPFDVWLNTPVERGSPTKPSDISRRDRQRRD